MDPLADKFLILSGFWAILIKEDLPGFWLFTASMVAITSIRELGITLFRINSLRSGISVAASIWGKWKTGVQLTALLVTLTALNTRDLLVDLGYTGYPFSGTILSGSIAVMFSLCAIIAVISGWFYLRDTRQ
jgi:CDP-diacylglycerol--glycerol-3-phosphate 3-phosphatidyltransferase